MNKAERITLTLDALRSQLWIHTPRAETTGDYTRINSINAAIERNTHRLEAEYDAMYLAGEIDER